VSASIEPPNDNPGIALVLGAGGTRGWAHVGVIEVLHEARLPVDLIVGASAGAVIGALYAARRDADFVRRVATSFSPTEFLEWFLRDLRIAPDAGRMGRRLWKAAGRLDFSELAAPFAAVALDLNSRRPVAIRRGRVASAVEASIRPPVISRPVAYDGLALVDGGLQNAVPVSAARRLGARFVVSVGVGELFRLPPVLRPFSADVGAAFRAVSLAPDDVSGQIAFMGDLLSRERPPRAQADVEVRPDMRGLSSLWPWHIPAAVERGRRAARRALPYIQRALAARAV
jgi:NTE family protein